MPWYGIVGCHFVSCLHSGSDPKRSGGTYWPYLGIMGPLFSCPCTIPSTRERITSWMVGSTDFRCLRLRWLPSISFRVYILVATCNDMDGCERYRSTFAFRCFLFIHRVSPSQAHPWTAPTNCQRWTHQPCQLSDRGVVVAFRWLAASSWWASEAKLTRFHCPLCLACLLRPTLEYANDFNTRLQQQDQEPVDTVPLLPFCWFVPFSWWANNKTAARGCIHSDLVPVAASYYRQSRQSFWNTFAISVSGPWSNSAPTP